MQVKVSAEQTPVTIITGFLGAGKTTYLNAVLAQNPAKKFAIIENEFGKKSIDSDFILRAEDGVMELNNGCLCCTLNEGLYDILNELYARRSDFSELLIEATGVADPRGLAAPFITNPAIKKQFPLKQVICLVDALLIEEQLQHTEEAIHQITYSDIILVSKTDLVDALELTRVRAHLQQLNPLATIELGSLEHTPDLHERSPRFSEELLPLEVRQSAAFTTEQTTPHNHRHTAGLKSLLFTWEEPFDAGKFRLRMHVFLKFQAQGLFRMKGTLWLRGMDEKYYLQAVGTQLSIDRLRKWDAGEPRKTEIVLIGLDLQRDSLEKMFQQCR